jgi:hypothetical protein
MDWWEIVPVIIGAAIALGGTVVLDQSRKRRERHAELCAVYDRVIQLFEADYLTTSEPVAAAIAMQTWVNRTSQAASALAIHDASPEVKKLVGDYRKAVLRWGHSAWSPEGQVEANRIMAEMHGAMEAHLKSARRGRFARLAACIASRARRGHNDEQPGSNGGPTDTPPAVG